MSPAVTLHLLLNSFFPIVSLPLKIKESISRLTSRRLHFCDSCWFLSRERRVFFSPAVGFGEPVCLTVALSFSLCVSVYGWETSSRFPDTNQTHPPANHVQYHTTTSWAPRVCTLRETEKIPRLNGGGGWMFIASWKVIICIIFKHKSESKRILHRNVSNYDHSVQQALTRINLDPNTYQAPTDFTFLHL